MIRLLRSRFARVTAQQTDDSGLSLTEMLVAMAIFSVLLAMTLGFFVSASRANQSDHTIDTSNRTASTGMDEVARMLRGATTHPVNNQVVDDPAFATAGANTITFYTNSNLSGATSSMLKVTISTSGTNLVESVFQPTVSGSYFLFGSVATRTKIIASPIVLPASGGPNLFTYVDSNGAAIALTSGTVANVGSIAAVTVNVQVGTGSSNALSTLLTNTVGLPNLQIARNPS